MKVNSKNAKEAIISIAEELIRRAEDITNDLDHVRSIHIEADLNPCEIVNFNVNKNYIVPFDKEGK